MKKLFTVLLLVFVGHASAQESAPPEKAREIARMLVRYSGDLKDGPFKPEPDLENPQAMSKDNRGLVIIPQKGVTAGAIAKAGEGIQPLAMMWTRGIAPAERGMPANLDGLRKVVVSERGKQVTVYAFFLAIATREGGRQELLVYGKGSKPMLSTRLLNQPARQDAPLELAIYGGDDTGASLLVSIHGKYQAELNITLAEEAATSTASAPSPRSSSAADDRNTEKALEAATILSRYLNKFDNLPVRVEGDASRADLFEGGDAAILVIPDERLAAKALREIGSKEFPVGQLWMKGVAPEIGGRAAMKDELQTVTIEEGEKKLTLPQFLLAARSAGKGKLELAIYSGGAKPLLTVPVREVKTEQDLPVELEGAEAGPNRGILSIYLVGGYYAELEVATE